MTDNNFTIRVYGILTNDIDQVLVTDELYQGKLLTKFPGGGLEYGEGTKECLTRECSEEMGIDIEVGEHFYTTDFFISSIFNNNNQIICIYYRIKTNETLMIKTTQKKFDFPEIKDGVVIFRWVNITDIQSENFTFKNDTIVAKMIYESSLKG